METANLNAYIRVLRLTVCMTTGTLAYGIIIIM